MELVELITTELSQIQFYGLVFLFGSYTVSSLSDLRRMAAQRDFAEVWGVFTIAAFLVDLVIATEFTTLGLIAKWLVIILFIVISTNPKHYLRLSFMDIAAIVALFSLLPMLHLLISVILLVVLNELMTPILKQWGKGAAYPFLPVVWLVNLVIILIHLSGVSNEISALL